MKIASEDDLESRVQSNWAPGNIVHPSNSYKELPQEVPGINREHKVEKKKKKKGIIEVFQVSWNGFQC